MAGLTQRTAVATTRRAAAAETQVAPKEMDETIRSGSVTPPMSNSSSSTDIRGMDTTTTASSSRSGKGKSMAERSQIPYSFLVTFGTVLGIEYFSGMWRIETVHSWFSSLKESAIATGDLLGYALSLALTAVTSGDKNDAAHWTEYARTGIIFAVCASLFYVFFVAPFAAGFWTGRKTNRHKFHRYMGLTYLIHYVLAWVEFFTNYGAAKNSFLCHIVAVIGTWPSLA